MKKPPLTICATVRFQASGFTLVELMISLSIGLIIAGASFYAYLGTTRATKIADAQGRMYEDGQAALIILTQQLRMAGANPEQANRVDNTAPALSSRRNPVYLPIPAYAGFAITPSTYHPSGFSIRGCSTTFGNIGAANQIDDLNCMPGSGAQSIAVSYEADRFNTVATDAGLPTDCLGNALTPITATLPVVLGAVVGTANITYTVADNRFYVGTTSTMTSLYCKGNGATQAMPLVDNVEDLQFSYGATSTTSTDNTATVAGYLSADQISTQADMAALPNDAARWAKVLTVRICIVVRSEAPVLSNLSSARYLRCDGSLETAPPDLRLRHAYFTTVMLRNRRL